MFARTSVGVVQGPIDEAAIEVLRVQMTGAPRSLVVTQLPGRNMSPLLSSIARSRPAAADLAWLPDSQLQVLRRYALPNGRRYALLELKPSVP